MPRLVLASKNRGKIREFQMLVEGTGWKIIPLTEISGLPEVKEDGKTFRANAIKKAVQIAVITGEWTIADDSGLEVDALNGAPGVLSARFAGPQRDDAANNRRLLDMLGNLPLEARTARYKSVIALSSPEGEVWTTEGVCEGKIGFESRGAYGFGYDPLFFLPEYGMTMAELLEEEKNKISHRGKAMRKLLAYLEEMKYSMAGSGSSEMIKKPSSASPQDLDSMTRKGDEDEDRGGQ